MSEEWSEVRRGVPAEEIDGLADEALDWANWMNKNDFRIITIYQLPGDPLRVIAWEEDDIMEDIEAETKEDALRVAERLREEDDWE